MPATATAAGEGSGTAGTLGELAAVGAGAAARARAGLPPEAGLGVGAGGRGGRLARRLGERLRSGENLADAWAGERGPLPDALRAVVEAGVRAGDPAGALVRAASHARLVAGLRRDLRAAAAGPAAVLLAAVAVLVGVLPLAAAELAETFRQVAAEPPAAVAAGAWVRETLGGWAWLIPVGLAGLAVPAAGPLGGRALGWVPGVGAVRRHLRWATAAHLLSLLTAAGVPLPEAVRLAAGTLGRRGRAELEHAADRMETGEDRAAVFAGGADGTTTLPALVRWALGEADARGLPAALGAAAAHHARRARAAADRCRAVWPPALTAVVGGLVLLGYLLGLLAPALALVEAVLLADTGVVR